MCIICLLWEKERLTNLEALKATNEMVQDEHTEELKLRIHEKLIEELEIDI